MRKMNTAFTASHVQIRAVWTHRQTYFPAVKLWFMCDGTVMSVLKYLSTVCEGKLIVQIVKENGWNITLIMVPRAVWVTHKKVYNSYD